jgi:hypothetical protein
LQVVDFTELELFFVAVMVKGLLSFAAENVAQHNSADGRESEQTVP